MTFVHPGLLWALWLGAIPILIYYLLRFRSLRVVWGADYVLERALERMQKRLIPEQILLLALRVLACAALVLAFARPAARSRDAVASSTGVHRIVAVDVSYSMLAGEEGRTRWDRATAALRKLVSSWGRGEIWSLCAVGEKVEWLVEGAAMATPEEAMALIDALEPREVAASLPGLFEAIAARAPEGRVELYLFADDQASAWEGVEQLAAGPEAGRPVYWLNPPLDARGNLAVTSARVAHDVVLAGHPCKVFVAVRNFGAEPVSDAQVELLVDGRFSGKESFSVLPGQETWLALDLELTRAGSHHATARVGRDALRFDNAMSVGLEVAEALSVVVLRDKATSAKFSSAWDFLQIAGRAQTAADEEGRARFSMGPLGFALCEDGCSAHTLADADVVLLDGGRTLTPKLAAVLADYVRDGGSLVLAADDAVDVDAWTEHLGGAGLLPAPLRRLHVETMGGKRYQSLARAEISGPAPAPLASGEDGDVAHARFYAWWELGEPHEGAAVRARFADGRPFLLTRRAGLGSAALLTAGLNGRDNNLIVREFFLPLLFWVFSESASGRVAPRTVGVGEPIELRLADTANVRAVSFDAGGAEPVVLAPVRRIARVPRGAARSGLCSILVAREGGAARTWYGVQGERADSDLTPLGPEAKRKIATRLDVAEAADWDELDEILQARRRGREWHHYVVVLLLALLFGEMLFQRRFV